MKCFKRLVMAHINSSLPTCLDPLRFSYQHKSTEDAISLALQSSLEHLDNKDTHIRLLLVDYSSASNTIIPSRLISKLRDLGLSFTFCNWILSFLTKRPQSVRIESKEENMPPSTSTEPKLRERLRKFRMSIRSLTNFYRRTIESILSGCTTAWCGNCSAQDHKKLQQVLCTAQTITEANLPSTDSIYMACCHRKVANIKDPSHP
eukprot:g27409.t1